MSSACANVALYIPAPQADYLARFCLPALSGRGRLQLFPMLTLNDIRHLDAGESWLEEKELDGFWGKIGAI